MLMLPPPVPLCVDSEPDSTAVSEFVKGAWGEDDYNSKCEAPFLLSSVVLQWKYTEQIKI